MYGTKKLNNTNIVHKHNELSFSNTSEPYREGFEKHKMQVWFLSEQVYSMIANK